MRHIDFFYFLGSGYAYLSVMRIKALAEKAGISVAWRPFNVRPLMQENNVALRTEKAKVKYLWRDIERRCATHGIAFVKPPIWTTDPDLLANRVAIVARQEGWIEPYTLRSFQAWYLEGLPLGTEESLAHILGQLGKQTSSVIERANSADTHAQLEQRPPPPAHSAYLVHLRLWWMGSCSGAMIGSRKQSPGRLESIDFR